MSKWSLFFSREMCLLNTKTFGYAALGLLMIISAIDFQAKGIFDSNSAFDNFVMYILYIFIATAFLSNVLLFQLDFKRIVIKGEVNNKFKFTSESIFQFSSFFISFLMLGIFFLVFNGSEKNYGLLSLEALCILLFSLSVFFGAIGFTKVWLERKQSI